MIKFLKEMAIKLKSQCPSTKILLIIGFMCLINTSATIFFNSNITTPTDVAIRSTMASIFGYIFGEHCLPNKFGRKDIQILIAGCTSLICLIVIIILHWSNLSDGYSNSVEIRNLLFTSVGFLISKAKNSEDPSC